MFFNSPLGPLVREVVARDTELLVLPHVLPKGKVGLNFKDPDVLLPYFIS